MGKEISNNHYVLNRRSFFRTGLSGVSALCTLGALPGTVLSRGSNLLEQLETKTADFGLLTVDALTIDSPRFDAKKARAAGLNAAVVDLMIYPRSFTSAVLELAKWGAACRNRYDELVRVSKANDIHRAKAQDKLAIILACQDGSILDAATGSVSDDNLDNLGLFYDLGIRVLQLTHNERNSLGDSFREKSNAGLSRLGERVVQSMNGLGMLVDLSHCGDQTTMEAIRLSSKPCAITHAGCRALYPTLRNKSDEQIRTLADKGGFFGVFSMSLWLTKKGTTSVDDVVDHIDHAVKVGGIDHVGFASDGPVLGLQTSAERELEDMRKYVRRNLGMPGAESIPSHVRVLELNAAARLSRLAEALSRRGYKTPAIEKVVGGNFLRVFTDVCG